jgi:hypothetical protein
MRILRNDGTPRPEEHTDFRRALMPGATFESSEGLLLVRQVLAGDLVLPSGRIIATDPCYLRTLDGTPPFVQTVRPGRYPVWLAMTRLADGPPWGERVACAVLQLTEAPAVRWELALRPGEHATELSAGQFYGHGVDSGNACFVDAAAVEALDDDAREQLYRAGVVATNQRNGWRRGFANVPVSGDPPANLVAFSSGYGDGFYPSWWGFDETGDACALATDFIVLVEELVGEARFPLSEWADRVLVHPNLASIGARVWLPPLLPGAREVLVVVDGNDVTEVALADGTGRTIVEGGQLTVSGERSEHLLRLPEPLPDDAMLVLTYMLGLRGL